MQVTPPGLHVPAGEAAEFMSNDCVTVREGVAGGMITPQPKPPSPSRRRWTAAEDAFLGTKSDRALARKFGRTVKAIKARRQAKGVFLVKEWKPEDNKILGTRPDLQAAMLLGRSAASIAWRRRKLGIPYFYKFRRWTLEQLELLGQKSDEEVATLSPEEKENYPPRYDQL